MFYYKNTVLDVQPFKSCNTEDWSNDAENSALITGLQ